MNHRRILTFAGLLLASLMIGACSALESWAPSFLGGEAKPVTFYLTIPPDGFSPEAELRVSLWTAEQVAASEKIANCAISQDPQTGEETVQCPEGIEYQEITPETFTFPIASLSEPLAITSQRIHEGEKYLLQATGLSQDNCNMASTRYEGVARSETVRLELLDWLTTEMACP